MDETGPHTDQHDAAFRALLTQGDISSKASIWLSVRIEMMECFHPDERYRCIAKGWEGVLAPVSIWDAYGTLMPAKQASFVGVRSGTSISSGLHNAN